MKRQLGNDSQKVLQYVKDHPGAHMKEIALKTGVSEKAAADSLFSLWHGGYVRRWKGEVKNAQNMPVFQYKLKALNPRGHKKGKKAKRVATQTKADMNFEVLIAVKSDDGTAYFTVGQMRALVRKLKDAGLA